MPRSPRRAPTYRQTMDALQQAYLTILRLTELAASLQEQLAVLGQTIAPITARDNGRSQ